MSFFGRIFPSDGGISARRKGHVILRHQGGRPAHVHDHLGKAGIVFDNPQAIYGSVAMAIPKGPNSFRTVTETRAINDTIEPAGMPKPNLENESSLFADATASCTLDMQQGYWQVPLSEDAQEVFTMVTLEGLFIQLRVPPGVLNATGYFQMTTLNVLDGYIDKIRLVWVHHIVIWGETSEILLKRLIAFGLHAGARSFLLLPASHFLSLIHI